MNRMLGRGGKIGRSVALLFAGVLGLAWQSFGQPVPATTPFSRYLLLATNGTDAAARIGVTGGGGTNPGPPLNLSNVVAVTVQTTGTVTTTFGPTAIQATVGNIVGAGDILSGNGANRFFADGSASVASGAAGWNSVGAINGSSVTAPTINGTTVAASNVTASATVTAKTFATTGSGTAGFVAVSNAPGTSLIAMLGTNSVVNTNFTVNGILNANGAGVTNLNTQMLSNQLNQSFLNSGSLISSLDNPTFLAFQRGQMSGNTFSNLNRYSWVHIRDAFQNSNSITAIRLGDGLTGEGMLIPAIQEITNLWQQIGWLGSEFPHWMPTNNPGAALGDHTAMWYPEAYILTNVGCSVGWAGYFSQGGGAYPKSPVANVATIFYEQSANAANFAILTNINEGAWTIVSGLGNVSGAGTLSGQSISVTNPVPCRFSIMISNVTSGKSIKVATARTMDTTRTGTVVGHFAGGGSDCMYYVWGTNQVVSGGWWQAINPTIILNEWLGPTDDCNYDSSTYTNVALWSNFVHTNMPACDFVWCGIYPAYDPSGFFALGNFVLSTNAQAYGYGYFDGWSPFVDSQTMTNRGYFGAEHGGSPHATTAGYGAYDGQLSYWLDFASGLPPAPSLVATTTAGGLLAKNSGGVYRLPTFNGVSLTNLTLSISGTNATPPGNTSTILSWANVILPDGTVWKTPLYK